MQTECILEGTSSGAPAAPTALARAHEEAPGGDRAGLPPVWRAGRRLAGVRPFFTMHARRAAYPQVPSGRQPRRFGQGEHQVEILDGHTAGTLAQIVENRHQQDMVALTTRPETGRPLRTLGCPLPSALKS